MALTLNLLYFAHLRDRLGRAEEQVQMNAPCTPTAVLQQILPSDEERHLLPSLGVAVNGVYTTMDHPLEDADEVVFISPIAGG